MRVIKTFGPALGVAAGVVLTAAAPARAAVLKVDYGIWLAGLPLGTADLATTFEGSRYALQIRARLTGLAGAITGGKGAATAAGSVAGGHPLPSSFAVTSKAGNDQRTVRMGLADGTVAAIAIVPPLEEKPDRVPVREVDKRGVTDPASALLMPSLTRDGLTDPANCNRTIPVFDGAARFDVILTYAETKTVTKPGYSGPVIVCSARYKPISGHRSERPATKFMEQNDDMSVWLAPVAGTRVLAPMRISVRTMLGTSVIEASRWEVEDGTQPKPTGARIQRRAKAD